MFKTKFAGWTIILILVVTIGLASIPTAKANPQFVISSWVDPDDFGQGISTVYVYENSTGVWLSEGTTHHDETGVDYDWNVSVGIKLRTMSWINSTHTGAVSLVDGRNYFRHNVSVSQSNGTIVFSQQNFTYFSSSYLGVLYWYIYEVVLNFLPEAGQIYIATITYEVYY